MNGTEATPVNRINANKLSDRIYKMLPALDRATGIVRTVEACMDEGLLGDEVGNEPLTLSLQVAIEQLRQFRNDLDLAALAACRHPDD